MSNQDPKLCEDCFTGFLLDGTPKGSESQIGPFMTYTAQPPQGGSTDLRPEAAIVLFTDIFGFSIPNSKLIADQIAEQTGMDVYVPDLFFGNPILSESINLPQTADQARNQGMIGKLKMVPMFLPYAGWFIKNQPSKHIPQASELIKILRTKRGIKKVGAVGYCYGGKFATIFAGTEEVDAAVVCHPSMLTEADLVAIKSPISFALAEVDNAFGSKLEAKAKEVLDGKKSSKWDGEIVTYKGTAHGFAARPNLAVEDVKKGFHGAMAQTCAFFKKQLVY